LFLVDRAAGEKPFASVNLLLRHGVRSCLELQKTGDPAKARAATNRPRPEQEVLEGDPGLS
jgi:alkaline phosphatase D